MSTGHLNRTDRAAGVPSPAVAVERLVGLEAEAAQLRRALETRTQIAMAVGVLAQRHGCTTAQAWALLRRLSSHTNLKVREVARLLLSELDGTTTPDDLLALGELALHLPSRSGRPGHLPTHLGSSAGGGGGY